MLFLVGEAGDVDSGVDVGAFDAAVLSALLSASDRVVAALQCHPLGKSSDDLLCGA